MASKLALALAAIRVIERPISDSARVEPTPENPTPGIRVWRNNKHPDYYFDQQGCIRRRHVKSRAIRGKTARRIIIRARRLEREYGSTY